MATDRAEQFELLGQTQRQITVNSTGFVEFIRSNMTISALFSIGIAAATACFWFTLWLSQQNFQCPSWAIHCSIKAPVVWIVKHLGLVQGAVSTIYNISTSMVAYTVCEAAETTLWPLLALQPTRVKDIDRFLSTARSSLPS